MVRKKSTELTPAEWKVMKIVWQLGSGAARDIYQIAGEQHDWAPTTVKKFLSRLVDKGFDRELLLRRALITPSCGTGGVLSEPLAERVLRVLRELSLTLRARYGF